MTPGSGCCFSGRTYLRSCFFYRDASRLEFGERIDEGVANEEDTESSRGRALDLLLPAEESDDSVVLELDLGGENDLSSAVREKGHHRRHRDFLHHRPAKLWSALYRAAKDATLALAAHLQHGV